MTGGLEVLVQEVIAAITTAPWSISNEPSSADSTSTGLEGRPSAPLAAELMETTSSETASSSPGPAATGSEAGKVSSRAPSRSDSASAAT